MYTTQLIFEKITDKSSENQLDSDLLLIEIATMIRNLIQLSKTRQKSNN